jgi:hypothetical protein
MYIIYVFVYVDMFLVSILRTTACTRYGGLGMQKFARNVSDGYDIC